MMYRFLHLLACVFCLAWISPVVCGSNSAVYALPSSYADSLPGKSFLLPLPAYNVQDGWMAGLVAGYSPDKSGGGFRCLVAPLLSLQKPNLNGIAECSYTVILDSAQSRYLVYSTGIKRFHYNARPQWEYRLGYMRIDPGIALKWHHPNDDQLTSVLQAKLLYILEDVPLFSPQGQFLDLGKTAFTMLRLQYNRQRSRDMSDAAIRVRAEFLHSSYENKVRLSFLTSHAYKYLAMKALRFRWYGAWIPYGASTYAGFFQPYNRASISLMSQGFTDAAYDGLFMARAAQGTMQRSQVNLNQEGAFRTPLGSAYQYGISNLLASSIHVSADIPFLPSWLPLEVYTDYGIWYRYEKSGWRPNAMFNAGVSLRYSDWLAIHFPFVFSEELGELYKDAHPSVFSRLSFTVDLQHWIEKWKESGRLPWQY